MGMLCDYSLPALVVFGVTAQVITAGMFFWLRKLLAGASS